MLNLRLIVETHATMTAGCKRAFQLPDDSECHAHAQPEEDCYHLQTTLESAVIKQI